MIFTRLFFVCAVFVSFSHAYGMKKSRKRVIFPVDNIFGPIHRDLSSDVVIYKAYLKGGDSVVCTKSQEKGISCVLEELRHDGCLWEVRLSKKSFYILERLYAKQEKLSAIPGADEE